MLNTRLFHERLLGTCITTTSHRCCHCQATSEGKNLGSQCLLCSLGKLVQAPPEASQLILARPSLYSLCMSECVWAQVRHLHQMMRCTEASPLAWACPCTVLHTLLDRLLKKQLHEWLQMWPARSLGQPMSRRNPITRGRPFPRSPNHTAQVHQPIQQQQQGKG